jgi:hypothetical protein
MKWQFFLSCKQHVIEDYSIALLVGSFARFFLFLLSFQEVSVLVVIENRALLPDFSPASSHRILL